MTDRPLNCSILNGNICTTGHLIRFVFGATVGFSESGFSESADQKALFSVGPNTIGIQEKDLVTAVDCLWDGLTQ